jgi:hypothetical protein
MSYKRICQNMLDRKHYEISDRCLLGILESSENVHRGRCRAPSEKRKKKKNNGIKKNVGRMNKWSSHMNIDVHINVLE